MRVASKSMTSQPGIALPAISIQGNPAGVASIIAQARFRALAVTFADLARVRLSVSSRVRRTVVSDGGAPNTGFSWDRTSMSDMLVAPSAIAAAMDTSATPGRRAGTSTAGPAPAPARRSARSGRPPVTSSSWAGKPKPRRWPRRRTTSQSSSRQHACRNGSDTTMASDI